MKDAVFFDDVLTPDMDYVIVNPWLPGADQVAWAINTAWMTPAQAENFRTAHGLP